MIRFSSKFKTYYKWRRGRLLTPYTRLIIRKYHLSPESSLAELRKISLKKLDLSEVPWRKLSTKAKDYRLRSLQARHRIRKGEALEVAAKLEGISVKNVRKHLGNVLYKRGQQWFARKIDNMERERWLYSQGKRIDIIIRGSKKASLISRYLARVRQTLETRDETVLDEFKEKTIADVDGKKHSFETDLETLYRLRDQQEGDRDRIVYYS